MPQRVLFRAGAFLGAGWGGAERFRRCGPGPSSRAPSSQGPSWLAPSSPFAFLAGAFFAADFLAVDAVVARFVVVDLVPAVELDEAFLAAAFVVVVFLVVAFLVGAFFAAAFFAVAFVAPAVLAGAFFAVPVADDATLAAAFTGARVAGGSAAVRAAALTGAVAAEATALPVTDGSPRLVLPARPVAGADLGRVFGFFDVGLERRARAESRRLGLRDAHGRARVWVPAGPGGALDAVEGAEPGDRDLPAAHDLTDDGVEDRLQGVVGTPAGCRVASPAP